MKKDKKITHIPDLEGEEWCEIAGYDSKYYVSNKGRVKSLKNRQPLLLKGMINNSGYERVALSKNGKRSFKFVSRLVAEYFVPNDDPLHKTTVDHIDGNKLRNTSDNLQWLSLSDNIKAYYKNLEHRASTENHNQA